MDDTLHHLDRLKQTERRVAMATLVSAKGTTPKKEGSKMLVGEHGRVLGSVTIGGCVDARVIAEAEEVLAGAPPRVVSMSLGDEDAWAIGMTCGGDVQLLIEPLDLVRTDDPAVAAYTLVREEVEAGRRAVLVAPLDGSPDRVVVLESGERRGSLGSNGLDEAASAVAADVLQRGISGVLPVGDGGPDAFFEVHRPPLTTIIFGATHVAMPLATIGKELGWRTVIVDARERFATRERFPLADELRIGIPSEIAESMTFDASTAVILVAHDYKFDVPVLQAVLAQRPAYVGLLGSRRRGRAILDLLREQGEDPARLADVHVPIGLDVGAQTAAEIALSIAAEVLAVTTGRPGAPMRDRPTPTSAAE
jgi:xanthine dehydrogenase accessory factor